VSKHLPHTVCRDAHRGRAAQESIGSESSNHAIELMIADLSSQAAIRELVANYKTTHTRLDVLVNNAGVRRRTVSTASKRRSVVRNFVS